MIKKIRNMYILEFAKSVDIFGNPIPAKQLKWKPLREYNIIFNERERAEQSRVDIMNLMSVHICRVRKMGLIKSWVFKNSHKDWLII